MCTCLCRCVCSCLWYRACVAVFCVPTENILGLEVPIMCNKFSFQTGFSYADHGVYSPLSPSSTRQCSRSRYAKKKRKEKVKERHHLYFILLVLISFIFLRQSFCFHCLFFLHNNIIPESLGMTLFFWHCTHKIIFLPSWQLVKLAETFTMQYFLKEKVIVSYHSS